MNCFTNRASAQIYCTFGEHASHHFRFIEIIYRRIHSITAAAAKWHLRVTGVALNDKGINLKLSQVKNILCIPSFEKSSIF